MQNILHAILLCLLALLFPLLNSYAGSLPDFIPLVEKNNTAVVNISTTKKLDRKSVV